MAATATAAVFTTLVPAISTPGSTGVHQGSGVCAPAMVFTPSMMARWTGRAAVQNLNPVVAVDQVVVFPLTGAVAIDRQGSQAEEVLHHRADAGGGVILVFRDGREDVAIRVGVVHVVSGKQQPARHGKTRELLGGIRVVGVFELHTGRR